MKHFKKNILAIILLSCSSAFAAEGIAQLEKLCHSYENSRNFGKVIDKKEILKRLGEVALDVLKQGSWEDVASFTALANIAKDSRLGIALSLGGKKTSILQYLVFYGRYEVTRILLDNFCSLNTKTKTLDLLLKKNNLGHHCFSLVLYQIERINEKLKIKSLSPLDRIILREEKLNFSSLLSLLEKTKLQASSQYYTSST